MSAPFSRTRTVIHHDFVLPLPANATEHGQQMSAAMASWERAHPNDRMPDDALTVDVEDGNLVVTWSEEQAGTVPA